MKIAIVSALTGAALAAVASPNPTGTRPTQLTNVVVAATSATTSPKSALLKHFSSWVLKS